MREEEDEFREMMKGMQKIQVVKGIDTGEIWECPVCHRRFRLIHRSDGKHELEELKL